MRRTIAIVLALWVGSTPVLTVDAFAQSAHSPRVAERHHHGVRALQPQQRCLRALDGSCTKLAVVESVRLRGLIFSTMRVSYNGTPVGTVPGGTGIERLFRDNSVLYGLPIAVYGPGPCCILRTK